MFVVIFCEGFGLPLPGETMLVAAGGLAATGKLPVLGIFAVAAVAAALGDNVGFAIGRFGGRALIARWGAKIGIGPERLDKVHAIVRRHGAPVVIVARFVPLLRQLNGISAGAAGMPWLRFVAANVVGALLWAGTWTYLPYRFGEVVRAHHAAGMQIALFGVVIVAAVALVVWMVRRRSLR